jgi:Uma2 family endonuclease
MIVVMESEVREHLVTADEFLRMWECGIFPEGACVDLIEGRIIAMPHEGPDHIGTVAYLTRLMIETFRDHAATLIQSTVRLSDISLPQPDVTLLKPRADFYRKAHARPDDILLVAEVSHTTRRYDLGRKVPFYARHGIPEVWVFDLEDMNLHVFRRPLRGDYAESTVIRRPGVLQPLALPHVQVDVSKVFEAE